VFTFVIGTVWGVLRYRARGTSRRRNRFLVLFFLFYVAVGRPVHAASNRQILRGYVDGTLVFGLPIVAFGLQTSLAARAIRSALASSARVAVSARIPRRRPGSSIAAAMSRGGVLVEAFVALGVAFPDAGGGRSRSIAVGMRRLGALEGSALIWNRLPASRRRLPRAFWSALDHRGRPVWSRKTSILSRARLSA